MPLACRTRRLRPKNQVPSHSRCGTIKALPYSTAVCAEHRPKISSPSLLMMIGIMYSNIQSAIIRIQIPFDARKKSNEKKCKKKI